MRLVIATPLYPPEPGGPATYAKLLEGALRERGWKVDVVKFSDVRALPKAARHFSYFRRVYRAAKNADAVLALDPVSVGYPAMMAARFAHKRFFVKIVGDYAWEQGAQRYGVTGPLDDFVKTPQRARRVRLFQRIQTAVARNAARVIVPSEYLKTIVSAWGIDPEKIVVVYNAAPAGADAGGHANDANNAGTAAAARAALPDGIAEPFIMTIARLVPWKGIADAIRAMGFLRSKPETASLRYVVAGDGPEYATLVALARDLGLADAVIFTGALPNATALSYLSHASAFILPTRYEGLSHTILEAFGAGVPVVTTPVGGNPELVEDGKTGLMAPVGDAEAIAAAVARLMNDSALAANIARSARAKVEKFSAARMIDGTVAALSL